MVFVVERRTTKYLHTKRVFAPKMGVVLTQTARATTKFFPRNSLNYDFHENITPRKIPAIRYIYIYTKRETTNVSIVYTQINNTSGKVTV